MTAAEIGRRLEPNRDRRTIERELARGRTLQRNSDLTERQVYLADVGQRKHEEKAVNKGRGLKLGHDHALAEYLEKKIGKERYSPDAAIGEIKAKGYEFRVSLCTKTVYNYLDKEILLGISNKDLPVKKCGKRRKYRRTRKVALNNIEGRSIEERGEEIESREEYGHWEMDCVTGSRKACLLVLTQRKTREELLFKLAAKTQDNVTKVLDSLERQYRGRFREKLKTVTTDNGSEFLAAQRLEASSRCAGRRRTTVYYAHPYSAWERGSNENANRLIRRFIPKGTDIGKYTNADIKRIEHWMNNYPRRMFGYKSANEMCDAA
jgi:IS30 family transposase